MSARFFQGPKGNFVIVDYVVSLLAIPCNCFILESLLRSQFSLTGYRRFLISLTISDLYICSVNLLTFLYQALTSYTANAQIEKCGADILRSLMFVGFFANLFNLCGMSVDHLIGILYPLRYRYLINKRVARTAVALIWVVSIMLGFADFPVITLVYLRRHYGNGYSSGEEDFIWPASSATRNASQTQHGNMSQNYNYYQDNKIIEAALLQLLGVQTTMEPNFPNTGGDAGQAQDYVEYEGGEIEYAQPMTGNETVLYETPSSPVINAGEIVDGFELNKEPTELPPSAISTGDTFRCILPADIETLFRSLTAENGSFGNFENNSMARSSLEILKGIKCSNENLDWCTFYLVNNYWQEIGVISLTLIGAIFLVICYGRIFKEVFVNIDASRRSLRKLVMTTFLLLGTFTICWLPFMTFEFGMLLLLHSNNDIVKNQSFMSSTSLFIVHNCLNTILICYPLVDPLIYCSRVPLVQRYLLCRYLRRFPCVRDYLERVSLKREQVLGKSSIGRAAVYMREASSPHHAESLIGNNNKNVGEGLQAMIPSVVVEHPDDERDYVIDDDTPAPSPLDKTTFQEETEFTLRRQSLAQKDKNCSVHRPRQYEHKKLSEEQTSSKRSSSSLTPSDVQLVGESYDQLVKMNSEILPLSLYPGRLRKQTTGGDQSYPSLASIPKNKTYKRKTSLTFLASRRPSTPVGVSIDRTPLQRRSDADDGMMQTTKNSFRLTEELE